MGVGTAVPFLRSTSDTTLSTLSEETFNSILPVVSLCLNRSGIPLVLPRLSHVSVLRATAPTPTPPGWYSTRPMSQVW